VTITLLFNEQLKESAVVMSALNKRVIWAGLNTTAHFIVDKKNYHALL